MFNFSNCAEPSQITLGTIFTDLQGRRAHQAVCWDFMCITGLWYTCCLHPFTFSSKTKAWTKPRTGHGRSPVPTSQQEHRSLPEHKRQPCKQSAPCAEGEATSKTVPVWAWGSPICTSSKPGTVTLNKVAQSISPRQECCGTQTSSCSKSCLLLPVVSQPSGKSKARKQTLLLTPKVWKHTRACLVSRTPKRNTLLIPAGN